MYLQTSVLLWPTGSKPRMILLSTAEKQSFTDSVKTAGKKMIKPLKRDLTAVTSLLTLFLLIAAIVCSHIFLASEADHDCSGNECRICLAIAFIEGTLDFLSASAVCVYLNVSATEAESVSKIIFQPGKMILSPVLLKDKLSD